MWSVLGTVGDHIPYELQLKKTVGRLSTYLQGYGDLLVRRQPLGPRRARALPRRRRGRRPSPAPSTRSAPPSSSSTSRPCSPTSGWPPPRSAPPAVCAQRVLDQFDAGADSVILHGATPTELAPIVDAYRAVRPAGSRRAARQPGLDDRARRLIRNFGTSGPGQVSIGRMHRREPPPGIDVHAPPDRAPTFEDFYRAEQQWVARLAFVITGDAEVAADLAQDAFTAMHGRFAGLDAPRAYLRVTLVRMAVRHRGARSSDPRHGADHEQRERPDGGHRVGGAARSRRPTARPAARRPRAPLLRGTQPRSMIAAALRCRPGTVKSLAPRALSTLRKDFE